MLLLPRLSAAGSITGISWDGAPPGTLADLSGQSSFSFGLPAFTTGVYDVTWLGGVTAWRDVTTIGADSQVLFDPGLVAAGTTREITMTGASTLWADTPDLAHAESTGAQWAFAAIDAQTWLWGLEDIALSRCDCDYQDAYGTLTRVGDVPPPPPPVVPPPPPFTPTPTPTPPPAVVSPGTVVPEPTTLALVAIGLAGYLTRRRRSIAFERA